MSDALSIYRGKDYHLNSRITIRQPTLGEIEEYGEQKYWSLVRSLTATPSDRKVEIWDSLHIYWDAVNEYDLFVGSFGVYSNCDMSILVPNLDFKSFEVVADTNAGGDTVLRNKDGVVIDRAVHKYLTEYLRQVHRFSKNVDIGANNDTKNVMIEDDRDEMTAAARRPYKSILAPAVMALTNNADFKYNADNVWGMKIGTFMMSLAQISHNISYRNLMIGIYTGNIDSKNIAKKQMDFFAPLD